MPCGVSGEREGNGLKIKTTEIWYQCDHCGKKEGRWNEPECLPFGWFKLVIVVSHDNTGPMNRYPYEQHFCSVEHLCVITDRLRGKT